MTMDFQKRTSIHVGSARLGLLRLVRFGQMLFGLRRGDRWPVSTPSAASTTCAGRGPRPSPGWLRVKRCDTAMISRFGTCLARLIASVSISMMLVVQVNATTDSKPEVAVPVQAPESASPSRIPDIFDDVTQLERVDADTSRAIVKKFLAENPAPRKYVVNAVSQGYDEDEANPALKLNQIWVGANSVLIEITGLARKRNAVSAVMRRDTLRIKSSKGEGSELVAFEGVTELRDRRGGIKQHLFCNFAKFLSLRGFGVVDKSLVLE